MFSCKTTLSCDICGVAHSSNGNRMSDCTSKAWCRLILKKAGWKVIYEKYDVCDKCVEHYGMKYIRKIFKEREKSDCE